MAILIKGDEIDRLVDRYCALTGLKNKSEAVRQALYAQIEALRAPETLAERVAHVQRKAGFASSGDAASDKAFMDDMWGE
ncbi:type II toxin-antitoxin system VapB family antitoxin [Paenirhodobacter sp.]|uniref:type II toxin-antitoxin system VapB family antitoxin n=1 Tax=Paenirhodobacter sp. TaxID=1965326 RepID=UPI003B3DEEEF